MEFGIQEVIDLPSFPVIDGDVKMAYTKCLSFICRTFVVRRVQGARFLLRRVDQGDDFNIDNIALQEIRDYLALVVNTSFRRIVIQVIQDGKPSKIHLNAPLLTQHHFDNRPLKPVYYAYMWKSDIWRPVVESQIPYFKSDGSLGYDRDDSTFEGKQRDVVPYSEWIQPSFIAREGIVTRTVRTLKEICCYIFRSSHWKQDIAPGAATPAYHIEWSFITGSKPEGVKKLLNLFNRPTAYLDTDPADLLAAVINVVRQMGFEGDGDVPPPVTPKFDADILNKSAGINLYERAVHKLEGLIIEHVWRSAKGESKTAGDLEFRKLVAEIRELVSDPALLHHYTGQIIRKVVTVCFPKPELGNPWRDPTKARLIFVVPYLSYLIDQWIYRSAIEKTYCVPPVGIGWSKSDGGCHFIFQHLAQYKYRDDERKVDDPNYETYEWFAIEGDFEKLDFSLVAALLTIVGMIPLFHYDTRSPDYATLRFFMEWSADVLASKFLHMMTDEERMVIGMMFSGSFLTSWGDTVYCWIGIELWAIYVKRCLTKLGLFKEAHHFSSIWPLPFWIYGDDHIGYLPSYLYPYVVGKEWKDRRPNDKPNAFSDFLKRTVNLNLKMSDSAVYLGSNCLLTLVNRYGEVIKPGPKFLQRRMVYGEADSDMLEADADIIPKTIKCHRVTPDYYTRASNTVNGCTWAHYVLKLRGLVVDTCGTNPEAYNFLKFVHDTVITAHPEVIDEIESINLAEDMHVLEMRRKIADSGLSYDFMHTFPSYAFLRDHYWPRRSAVRAVVANANRNGHFACLYA
jgi:hypothetical protein